MVARGHRLAAVLGPVVATSHATAAATAAATATAQHGAPRHHAEAHSHGDVCGEVMAGRVAGAGSGGRSVRHARRHRRRRRRRHHHSLSPGHSPTGDADRCQTTFRHRHRHRRHRHLPSRGLRRLKCRRQRLWLHRLRWVVRSAPQARRRLCHRHRHHPTHGRCPRLTPPTTRTTVGRWGRRCRVLACRVCLDRRQS